MKNVFMCVLCPFFHLYTFVQFAHNVRAYVRKQRQSTQAKNNNRLNNEEKLRPNRIGCGQATQYFWKYDL